MSSLAFLCAAVLFCLAASPLLAQQNDNWSGASTASGNWSDAGNWDNSPNQGDLLFFTTTSRLSNTNDFSGYTFNGVTFSNAANTFVLHGAAFTLVGGITNSGGASNVISIPILLGDNDTINAASNTLTLAGNVSGVGYGLVKEGAGVLKLSATNTYTGTTLLDAGQTQMATNGVFGTNVINVSSGAQLAAIGTGRLLTNAVANNGGTLRNANTSSTFTISGGVTLAADSFFNLKYHDSTELIDITSHPITGGFGFTLTDENTAGGTAGSPILRLSVANNNYAGNTTIASGTLRLNAATALPNGAGKGNVVLDGGATVAGTLDLFGNSASINGLFGISNSVPGTVLNNGSTATLTVGNNAASSTFSGMLQNGTGTLYLSKTGAGTLTLSGTNTYTGATSISAGTLVVNGALTASIAVTVQPSGTLTGIGLVNSAVTVNGTLVPGAGGIGALTINKALTFNSTGTNSLAIDRTSGTSTFGRAKGMSTVTFGGTLVVTSLGGTFLNGDTFTLFSATNYAGNFTVTNLPALASPLSWNWNPANGILAVTGPGGSRPTITNSIVNGSQLGLNWGVSGYTLQVQTNKLATGLSNNWVNVVPSTSSATGYTNTPDPKPGAVFYRLMQ